MSNKPVWALGYALNRCGVPCAEEIAMMLSHRHSYVGTVTAPTCTEGGYTTYACSCGKCYTDDFVPALGHVSGKAVEENRVEATPTAAGSYDQVVYCTRCGADLSRTTITIPMLKLKGYLYNGALLPAFKDWMKQEPLYFVWTRDGGGSIKLYVLEKPLPATVGSNGCHYVANPTSSYVVYSKLWGLEDGQTYFESLYTNKNLRLNSNDTMEIYSYSVSPPVIFWASYDVYKAVWSGDKIVQTDTILFPKSPDPIPVYE